MESTAIDISALESALELRFRRLWKDDIFAYHRGHIQETLCHVDARLTNADVYLKHSEARIEQAVLNALEDKIAAIVIKILAEYRVKGGDGKAIKYE